ncbi:MAG: hypothetical protein KIT25_23610 [Enhydrobacter sp.]|nr:MAG: hypothetical protein KIT25_23610 [Enhydrobacter sp.]
MTLIDIVGFARAIAEAGLVHYRKILDVIEARPAFTEAELKAFAQYAREYPVPGKRGALAFVVGGNRGGFAQLFASIEIAGRPAQLFRSIHEARKWLAENPPDD